MANGVIYILTNPAFPQFVKIGYADNIEKRLKDLNRSECLPFAFRVYATYEVNSRLSDLKIHSIIDRLNPNLRSIETFDGKRRVREFYAMSAEDAYSILEAIAEIHGCTDKLRLIAMNDEEKAAEEIVELVEIETETRKRSQPISLEEYLANKKPELVELYRELQTDVFDVLENVEMYVLPQYIGWRVNGKYFAELHVQRNRLMMLTLSPGAEYSIGSLVPDKYLWTLNYRSYFDSNESIEEAKEILRRSYIQR